MSSTVVSTNFLALDEYVRELLEPNGFNELQVPQQEKLLQEFVDQALVRIAAGLSPLLSPSGKERFDTMLKNSDATEEMWQDFWKQEIPDCGERIKDILDAYAEEVRGGFSA